MGAAGEASAQDDPENLYFQSNGLGRAFGWSFAAEIDFDDPVAVEPEGRVFPSCGQLTRGSDGAFDAFGSILVGQENNDLERICPEGYDLAYSDRGFVMDRTIVWNADVGVARQVYVPATTDFARWADRIDNPSESSQTVLVNYEGAFGWRPGLSVIETSSGDTQVTVEDDWLVVDDADDGGGVPAMAVVWSSPDADTRASFTDADGNWLQVQLEVVVPAGGTVTTLLFAVQAPTRGDATVIAQDLTTLSGDATNELDDDLDGLVNFVANAPGNPRVRMNGPYAVAEGGTLVVTAAAEDPEGEVVTVEWDLDDDGLFDDLTGTLEAPVSAAGVDGPHVLRVGLRVSDTTGHVVERYSTIAVQNVAPVVSSSPPASARTGVLYRYPIEASDFVSDAIAFAVEEGPPGLTVSAAGLVEWTPSADGRGPDVPVVLIVSDDDGGETEHSWTIAMGGAPTVQAGGPYRVEEGGQVLLAPVADDPEEDPLQYSWDLDGDGDFGDSDEEQVTWSAVGIDGPADGFRVDMVVSDGEFDVLVEIPVQVTNGAPEFVSTPPTIAVVDREWVYLPEAVDPGGDAVSISVDEDELPLGMLVDGDGTLRWTPTALDQEVGTVSLRITAEDEDNGRARQDVVIEVRDNRPPPVPTIAYPTGDEPVRTLRPTIILENTDDPDGDPLEYTIQLDRNLCFCSVDLMDSGPIPEGDLVTQWRLPRDLVLEGGEDGNDFYVRRWASDGLSTSDQSDGLSLFEVVLEDADDEDDGGAGCACRSAGPAGGPDGAASLGATALVALVLARRRRPS